MYNPIVILHLIYKQSQFMTIIIFILILGLVVLVHEFGHFITARKSGMKVFEFGFGFPPRAVGVYRDPITKKFVWVIGKGKSSIKEAVSGEETGEENQFPATLYSFNWLPLGGFCKMKGENGEKANEPDSFGFQKAWKRIVVLSAGVTMNFILAGLLLSIGFIIGLPADLSMGVDNKAIIIQEPAVMVQMVEKDSPAEKAGLKYGDKIISINNTAIKTVDDLVNYLKANIADQTSKTVAVLRGTEEMTLTMDTVQIKEGEDYLRFGFSPADVGIIRYPWYLSIYKGFVAAGFGVINIFLAFVILIKNLVIGQGLAFEVSGPVGIAVMVGDSARLGISYLINVAAMISLSLAVINILPIPALDGGRILFILIEKIFRRPVPMKYEQLAHTIGFLLLMILIIVVTGRDVWGLIK
ncbi:MAG TPA: RIP metalloprotease RseP [Candidatus Magasanikbacteria bacterium]|nr:RIP metalloprotease RseP [Candidatus Magasanikbacteria bacterium]